MAALLFNEKGKASAKIQNIEKLPNGRYRVTHDLPDNRQMTNASVELNGKVFPLSPDMSFGSACQFYLNIANRKIAPSDAIVKDLIHLNSLPARRAVTLVHGEWANVSRVGELYKLSEETPKLTPTPMAFRLKDEPYPMSEEKMMKVFKQGDDAFEMLLPQNILTISFAQLLGSKGNFERAKLPWQYYEDLFVHQVPEDVVAFEAGKASANDNLQFPELLHSAAFIALKEATLWNKPLSESYVYVHATDAPHLRLYKGWGFSVIERSKTNPKHHLLRASISEMLEQGKFSPARFSERIDLGKKHSNRDLSDQAAYLIGKNISEMMSLRLDMKINGEATLPIRVDDRSLGFYTVADKLLEAHGIVGQQAEEYKKGLSKIQRGSYQEKRRLLDVSHLPEEFSPAQAMGNVFIQELSIEQAAKDPWYLAKTFAGVSNWYGAKVSPFLDIKSPSIQSQTIFTALTRSQQIVAQARKLGFHIEKVKVKELGITSHRGDISPIFPDSEVFALSAPWIVVRNQLALNFAKQVEVKQGVAALKAELEHPVSD